MRYRIHGQGVKITASLRQEAERRLHFALARFSPSIRQVGLRLFDMNGPRGGVDKCCRIVVTMEPTETIVVEAENSDINAAIAMAADRIGRTIARAIHRRVKTRRRAGLSESADGRHTINVVGAGSAALQEFGTN